MTPINVDDWLDILGLVIVGLVIVAAATLPVIFTRRDVGAVKEQVVNGHLEPMRTDLDRVLTKLDNLAGKVGKIDGHVERLEDQFDDHLKGHP